MRMRMDSWMRLRLQPSDVIVAGEERLTVVLDHVSLDERVDLELVGEVETDETDCGAEGRRRLEEGVR